MARVFLLSPASCSGLRARMIMRPGADFLLARRLRESAGAPLGEVYTFLSGLYFRGKLAYARAFAGRPEYVLVITPTAGLRSPDALVTLDVLRGFARIDIADGSPRFRRPLLGDAKALVTGLAGDDEVILLGSIASSKYVDVLSGVFGARLKFPLAFVGRGDMSRGGLLLRCVTEGRELPYAPVDGAIRRGARPPKLPPLPRRVVPTGG
ncbi:MAG: hypothetical protein DMD91_19455 [Candidatus Rokuibacteriota bacterium]|nr:MAG: hypothetical protein DMD91_19455 [Candidatus Rokubacteria bacterium]